jgi:hypothetical protein
LDCYESWEACDSLGADWFGKPSNTLKPSSWIHSPNSGVMLLLSFGAIVSMVGWNVLGLQPVGVIFHKDNFSLLWYHIHVYECIFCCIFNYRLVESLDYACLLITAMHVVKVFSFMHL